MRLVLLSYFFTSVSVMALAPRYILLLTKGLCYLFVTYPPFQFGLPISKTGIFVADLIISDLSLYLFAAGLVPALLSAGKSLDRRLLIDCLSSIFPVIMESYGPPIFPRSHMRPNPLVL